ncbi:putative HRDC domain containing protein [Lyophyllum shimeji]|uniref:HRDC domain containing protein n=1 Tax=Lyophyllum shimeji TaxID=47721 RepID=A0A9P3UWV5_LYOSH|nr:putative HRDC domain containing protein [Lyophyllum shimeji]
MASEASSSTLTSTTYDEFNSQLQTNALKATRNALALPSDVAFHRSMDPTFARDLDVFSSRVLSLTNKVLALVATADATSSRAKGKGKLETQDDVIDNFHALVVDPMDQLLERTDMCLDEFLGRTKPPAIAINPVAQPAKKVVSRGRIDPVVQHASHIPKPQLLFKRRVENDDSPWYPSLVHKYNAQVPLGYDYHDAYADPHAPNLISTHPYRYEITHISYPKRMFQSVVPSPPKDLADTPFTWVSTTEGLQAMLAKLRQASEIAVDLEHHSYRSYAGFLCLMQISTREEDWIIDALALREELTELNEVFTDPKIVKVLHGAESDIVWLQQDFNIYIVNLFDTFHASKALDFPRHGLANLLEMYCDFTPDKRYQLADWRIRPLPQEMLDYARSDTHFLLYIYDNLRNALLDRAQSRALSRAQSFSPSELPPLSPSAGDPAYSLIRQVLARSEETALRTYEKEIYDAEGGSGSCGWDTLARKWNKGALLAGGPGVGAGALQRAVYQAVHKWREMIAREEDESTRYVLPNHFLFQLAEQPPTDMAALLRVFHSVPPVIRRRAKDLLEVIRECVKRHLSNSTTLTPAATEQALTPEVPIEPSVQPQALPNEASLSDLWKRTPASKSAIASSASLLFGSTLSAIRKSSQTTSSFAASKSSLFGNASTSVFASKPSSNKHPHESPAFREVVARINSTLVIAPSIPKISEQRSDLVSEEDVMMQEEVSGMQAEIPFVPAAQRKITERVEGSIVVVGQARQKKRKRTKPAPDGAAAISAEGFSPKNQPQKLEGAGSNDEPGDHEPFDFSAVPNILDDNPHTEDARQKKKHKKQKTGGVFYGDFPAPPKAHSELKRGNQSHTFK